MTIDEFFEKLPQRGWKMSYTPALTHEIRCRGRCLKHCGLTEAVRQNPKGQ